MWRCESVNLPLISNNDSWVPSRWPRPGDPGVYGLSLVLHLHTRRFPLGTSGLTPSTEKRAKFQISDKETRSPYMNVLQ